MAVVATIPAQSAPMKAPTNDTLGADIGGNLRRVRAMATQAPRPTVMAAAMTTRN